MALRERTRLSLVVSGPPPAALTTILSAVRHHEIDTLEAARRHRNTGAPPRSHASNHPWWYRAPFRAPDNQPWYALPSRPRRPARRPAATTPPPAARPAGCPAPARRRPPSAAGTLVSLSQGEFTEVGRGAWKRRVRSLSGAGGGEAQVMPRCSPGGMVVRLATGGLWVCSSTSSAVMVRRDQLLGTGSPALTRTTAPSAGAGGFADACGAHQP